MTPPPQGGGKEEFEMANLLEFSRDIMARTPEGKEALVAMRAIRDWKSSAAIRKAHGNLAAYHDVLVELHGAGAIKFKGEDFMPGTTKPEETEDSLALYQQWKGDPALRRKHGSFTAYLKADREERRIVDILAKCPAETRADMEKRLREGEGR